jgi:hypothetical protein
MKVKDAREFVYNYNRIYTNENRLYDYIDDSFSLLLRKFDINNAFDYWNYEDYDKSKQYYKYTNPITLNGSNYYKPLNEYIDPYVVLSSTSDKIKNIRTYWNVYKQNLLEGTRTLLFQVSNNNLFLKMTDPGIYDFEAHNYDEYGNKKITEKQSYIYIK